MIGSGSKLGKIQNPDPNSTYFRTRDTGNNEEFGWDPYSAYQAWVYGEQGGQPGGRVLPLRPVRIHGRRKEAARHHCPAAGRGENQVHISNSNVELQYCNRNWFAHKNFLKNILLGFFIQLITILRTGYGVWVRVAAKIFVFVFSRKFCEIQNFLRFTKILRSTKFKFVRNFREIQRKFHEITNTT